MSDKELICIRCGKPIEGIISEASRKSKMHPLCEKEKYESDPKYEEDLD